MNDLRLVVIAPRYWPLVGETERWVAHLASALRPHIKRVTVLTACWDGAWPREVIHQEIRIIRLGSPPRRGWHRFRYARSLERWLRQEAQEIDVAYTVNLRYDANIAVGAAKKDRFAVVLRTQIENGRWFDAAPRRGRLKRLLAVADAAIAPTRSLAGDLLSAGYAPERIHQIPDGAPPTVPRTAATRFEARVALAEANYDLRVAEYAPLAVSIGRLHKGRNLNRLVDAWALIAARWPAAKLWFLGDGPLRQSLYQRIRDAGLQHQVFLPGTFDELAEIFLAADVFVAPETTNDGNAILLEAMAAGVPVVAADTEDHREILEHGVHGLLVAPGNPRDMAQALETLLESPEQAAQFGAAARSRVEQRYSLPRVAEAHLRLFQQLAAESQSRML
jgi:glycosyltransferase involved in cell wall biosynthesis